MTEPKTYKIRGEATSFEPKTARFEGEITVWLEEQPPVEPPPAQPSDRVTRLAQYALGVGTHRHIEQPDDPYDIYARVATYGYQAQEPSIFGPGWRVATQSAHYGWKAFLSDVRYEKDPCRYAEWPHAFNGACFLLCTWNEHTFGVLR